MTGPQLRWAWSGDTITARVGSRSHPGRVHDVALAADGSAIGCSCPAHPRFGCWHQDAVRQAVIAALEREAGELVAAARGLDWIDQAPYSAGAAALAYQARGFREKTRAHRAAAIRRPVSAFGDREEKR